MEHVDCQSGILELMGVPTTTPHGLAPPLGQADEAERAVYETVLRAKRAEVDFLQGRAEATSMVRPLLVNDATHAPTPTLTDSDRH